MAKRLAVNAEVVVLSRNSTEASARLNFPGIRVVEMAGADPGRLSKLLDGVDVVFNLAGSAGAVRSNSNPADSLASICEFQMGFLEACASAKSRPHVVFASTRLVYGRPERLPVTENHPLNPQSFYAAHKLCVEHYHQIFAQRGTMSFTVCRISNPFGVDCGVRPSREYGFLNQMIRAGVEGRPLRIFGDGEQLRDYIFIEDLLDALMMCGTNPIARNETFNIGSGAGVSIQQAARVVAQCTGAQVERVPWPQGYIEVETGDFINGIGKVEDLLGFRPRHGFLEAVEKTAAGYRQAAAKADVRPKESA